MKYSSIIFIAASTFMLSACGLFETPQDTGPEIESKQFTVAGEVATAAERAQCESLGGEIQRAGMLGWEHCILPYRDAGQPCRGSADCEGRCLAENMADTGAAARGVCQADSNPFGCYAEMEDGEVSMAICVD